MTLPNFLGIGAMRCGTSWLYEQLRFHKDVFMAKHKELNFFTDFYDLGPDWYCRHFPSASDAMTYRAIGEITPTYIADPEVPSRIRAYIPDVRFIAILRDPVQRAYSEYTKKLRDANFGGSFDEFLARYDGVLDRGCYAQQLGRFFQCFSRRQFLVLIFEEAVIDHPATIQSLAEFLDIDPAGFDSERMKTQVNPSYLPRMRRLYSSYVKTRRFLVRNNLRQFLAAAESLGLFSVGRQVARFAGPRSELPKLDEKTQERLHRFYAPEILKLEDLLGRELSIWRAG